MQTEVASVAMERTCLSWYLCLGNWCSSTLAQTWHGGPQVCFNLLSVLNECSHSAYVIGNVHKMRANVWMLGKNFRSDAVSVWTALVGRKVHHFLFYCRSSTHDTGEEGEENCVSCLSLYPLCLAHVLYCCFLRVRGVLLNHTHEQIISLEFSQMTCWSQEWTVAKLRQWARQWV